MRGPRLILFLALCLVQLAIPLSMAYRYERTLRQGTLYRFRTEPFDPVDAFRGRYVAIRLQLVAPVDLPHSGYGSEVYATLGTDARGFATVRALSERPPASGDWLQGRLGVQPLGSRIELPFDRYYMEEGKAPEADRIWSEGVREAEATARVPQEGQNFAPVWSASPQFEQLDIGTEERVRVRPRRVGVCGRTGPLFCRSETPPPTPARVAVAVVAAKAAAAACPGSGKGVSSSKCLSLYALMVEDSWAINFSH